MAASFVRLTRNKLDFAKSGARITEFEFIIHLERRGHLAHRWHPGPRYARKSLQHSSRENMGPDRARYGGGLRRGRYQQTVLPLLLRHRDRARSGNGAKGIKWVDVSPPAPNDYDALFYPPMDVVEKIVAKQVLHFGCRTIAEIIGGS